MGTRADFYVGIGKEAEWLGSIAWDGYPDGIFDEKGISPETVITHEAQWRAIVSDFLDNRDDATRVDAGWPWPWDNSGTTDFAYSFIDGGIQVSCFGTAYMPLAEYMALSEEDEGELPKDNSQFPDMKDKQNVSFGKNSGLIIFGG